MNKSVMALAVPALVLQVLAIEAYGQEQAETSRRNSLEPGAWAIQFQITEEIGLKPFNGMMISLKRHLSAGAAVRLGASLNLSYDDTEWSNESVPADTLRYSSRTINDQNGQSVQLDLMYMGYPNVRAPVNFFWGTGPLIKYSRAYGERERVVTSPTGTFNDKEMSSADSWEAGVLGAAGVEWFAGRGISFHAEYRARLSYRKTETEQSHRVDSGSESLSTADGSSWQFSATDVILGLSVYF